MKTVDNSFLVLSAIILAGVIMACVPTANSQVTLNPESAPVVAAAVETSPKAELLAAKDARKSGVCAKEIRDGHKADAKRAHGAAKTPAV